VQVLAKTPMFDLILKLLLSSLMSGPCFVQ
jgi:hypothetical protein